VFSALDSGLRRNDAFTKPCLNPPQPLPCLDLAVYTGLLMGDAVNRAFIGADGRTRNGLDIGPRLRGIGNPGAIKLVGTFRHAAIAVAGIDHARVTAVQQLEQMVL